MTLLTALHPILDEHAVIAWDMDGTLVDGPNSEFFLDYIRATPHKRHHVVTFRNKAMAKDVWGELQSHGLDAKALIRSVENCPEPIHDCYMINHRLAGSNERHRYYRSEPPLTRDEFNAYVDQFVLWKGLRATQIGATILVDDMPQWVLPGCYEHEVTFLHAFDPC